MSKPKLTNGWIVGYAAFRPDDVSNVEWDASTPQQKAESAEFSPYRVKIDSVYAYNESSIEGCTTLNTTGYTITMAGTVQEFDKIFIPE